MGTLNEIGQLGQTELVQRLSHRCHIASGAWVKGLNTSPVICMFDRFKKDVHKRFDLRLGFAKELIKHFLNCCFRILAAVLKVIRKAAL